MNLYKVTIKREWERDIKAEDASEALDKAYEEINDCTGDDFDEQGTELLEEDVDSDEDEENEGDDKDEE